MQPTLRPGDRLLVGRWLRTRPGDIVVFRDPEWHTTFNVKRVASLALDGSAMVAGDNPNVSRDSRALGPVAPALIVGRAFYRYLPAERRGRL